MSGSGDRGPEGLFPWPTVGSRVVKVLARLEALANGGGLSDDCILIDTGVDLKQVKLRELLFNGDKDAMYAEVMAGAGMREVSFQPLAGLSLPKDASRTWVGPKAVADTDVATDDPKTVKMRWEAFARRVTYARRVATAPPAIKALGRQGATTSIGTTRDPTMEDVAMTEYLVIPERFEFKNDSRRPEWGKVPDQMWKTSGPPIMMLYRVSVVKGGSSLVSPRTQMHECFAFMRQGTMDDPTTTIHFSWVENAPGTASSIAPTLVPWLRHTMQQHARRFIAQILGTAARSADAAGAEAAHMATSSSAADDVARAAAELDSSAPAAAADAMAGDAEAGDAGAPGGSGAPSPSAAGIVQAHRARRASITAIRRGRRASQADVMAQRRQELTSSLRLQSLARQADPELVQRLEDLVLKERRDKRLRVLRALFNASKVLSMQRALAERERLEALGIAPSASGGAALAEGDPHLAPGASPGKAGSRLAAKEQAAASPPVSTMAEVTGAGLPAWFRGLTTVAVDDEDLDGVPADETWSRTCAVGMFGLLPEAFEREQAEASEAAEAAEALERGRGRAAEDDPREEAGSPGAAASEAEAQPAESVQASLTEPLLPGLLGALGEAGMDSGAGEAEEAKDSDEADAEGKQEEESEEEESEEEESEEAEDEEVTAAGTTPAPGGRGVRFADEAAPAEGEAAADLEVDEALLATTTGLGSRRARGRRRGRGAGATTQAPAAPKEPAAAMPQMSVADLREVAVPSDRPMDGREVAAVVVAGGLIAKDKERARLAALEAQRQRHAAALRAARLEEEAKQAAQQAGVMEAGLPVDRLPPQEFGFGEEEAAEEVELRARLAAERRQQERVCEPSCATM